jgi:citrate lyase subunit beta / citryl-CoA lyase
VVFHPRQVPIVNEAFSPAEDDLAWAAKIIELVKAEAAREEAGTIVVVDGDMVDGPFVVNAQQILARHERIRAFEERKLAGAAR